MPMLQDTAEMRQDVFRLLNYVSKAVYRKCYTQGCMLLNSAACGRGQYLRAFPAGKALLPKHNVRPSTWIGEERLMHQRVTSRVPSMSKKQASARISFGTSQVWATGISFAWSFALLPSDREFPAFATSQQRVLPTSISSSTNFACTGRFWRLSLVPHVSTLV
jgi:hypothetical protein